MEEIIVIRAADPDGSVFKAVVDALRGKRAEVVSVAAPVSSMLRIGELEIYHEQKRVIMAGREVQLNHGEYAMLYCMASSPGQVFSKAQLYAAAWGEEYLHGTNSVENIIWRLRKKLENDPKVFRWTGWETVEVTNTSCVQNLKCQNGKIICKG